MIARIHSALEKVSGEREQAVVSSALWAAAGDALGWITELSRGTGGVLHRAKISRVVETVDWQRMIGGRSGPRVDLPAGTYSDDTQLRLAVCRSIRGDGRFDVEVFAKVEITVWPTYALGAGLGTKAAALNLSRRSVNWYSNFFENSGQKYVSGGGNGAAMRIQPHVWASRDFSDDMLLDVLRDALTTHGHPQGFCGAIFHALCIAHVFKTGQIPDPDDWTRFASEFYSINRLIRSDPQLAAFWQSAWENDRNISVAAALDEMQSEAQRDIAEVSRVLRYEPRDVYRKVLESLGCLSNAFRGSGFKTALAAAALSYMHGADNPSEALEQAANELESDTDTIATMAGAILGAATKVLPDWEIQDREYIVTEASRLAKISAGVPQDSFSYPDLGYWDPPTKQTASIGLYDGGLVMAGLGALHPIGKEYRAGDAIWQWFSLPFGQSVLAKRSADLRVKISSSQLPGPTQVPVAIARAKSSTSTSVGSRRVHQNADLISRYLETEDTLDAWTDAVIQSDFNDQVLGQFLNRCIERTNSIDAAIAFASIVAKAKLARQRRRR